jgi:hypothetical protein
MLYVSPIVSLLLDPIVPELACTCPRVLLSTNLSLSLSLFMIEAWVLTV